jgi:hypothetical protein
MQIMSSHGPSHPASIADQRQLARYGDFPLFSLNFLNWFHGKVVFCYSFSVYSVILYVCLGMGIFCLGMGILYVKRQLDEGVVGISFILGKIRFSNDLFGSYQLEAIRFCFLGYFIF